MTVLDENPVTHRELSIILDRFYEERIEPGVKRLVTAIVTEVVTEVVTHLLARFYNDIIDPRFVVIEEKLKEIPLLRDEIRSGFDDLYKKFEDLQQEYTFANVHIRRLEAAVFRK
jgi:hypothetical protein